MIRRVRLALLLLIGGSLVVATGAMATMQWPDLLKRAHPKADTTVAYGGDPLQHVDVWLPKGAGPFPTVLMIHGGCWTTGIAKADIMDWIADDLRKRGIAVWNIDYRGVDVPGGGYPGTLSDVAAATDALRGAAPVFHLDATRIVAVGHSAGGHLALWTAARRGLPVTSPFYRRSPLPIRAVVSLGGLPDLEAHSVAPGNTCGSESVAALVGKAAPERADVYADTSPAKLAPPAAQVTLINGDQDHIAPPAFAAAYQAKMQAAGKAIATITIPNSGHVELISPETTAWKAAVAAIETGLGRK